MATIRTVEKRKVEVEIGGAKLEEEISHVACREVPLLRVKLAGRDAFVWVNAAQIVLVPPSSDQPTWDRQSLLEEARERFPVPVRELEPD